MIRGRCPVWVHRGGADSSEVSAPCQVTFYLESGESFRPFPAGIPRPRTYLRDPPPALRGLSHVLYRTPVPPIVRITQAEPTGLLGETQHGMEANMTKCVRVRSSFI